MSRKMGCVPNFPPSKDSKPDDFVKPILAFSRQQSWGHSKKLPEDSYTQAVFYTQLGLSYVDRTAMEMALNLLTSTEIPDEMTDRR